MKPRFLVAVSFALLAPTSIHVARAAAPTVPECLSASEASIKLRAEQRLRLATTQLLTCVSSTCPSEVAEECSRRMDRVTAAIPTIVFEVKDAAGNELSAVKVTMDGEVVADHLDGRALTLDPGSHKFTFEAAGLPPLARTFILHESEKGRRETIVIGSVGAAPAAPTLTVAAAPATPSESPAPVAAGPIPTETTRDDIGHGRRLLGLVVGGGGVAGLLVGGIFGALALSSLSTANGECPSHTGCSPKAISDRSTTLTYGNVSTGAFIAGGALLAGGLTLYFTAPKHVAQTVGVEVGAGMLGVNGTF